MYFLWQGPKLEALPGKIYLGRIGPLYHGQVFNTSAIDSAGKFSFSDIMSLLCGCRFG